jgi:hypothetical protein
VPIDLKGYGVALKKRGYGTFMLRFLGSLLKENYILLTRREYCDTIRRQSDFWIDFFPGRDWSLKKNENHEDWTAGILTMSVAVGFAICALSKSLVGFIVAALFVTGCFAGFFLLDMLRDSIKDDHGSVEAPERD